MSLLTGIPASDDIERWLDDARGGSSVALDRALGRHMPFLQSLAGHQTSPELGSPSAAAELVRGTLRRAREGFGQFAGRNETELRTWLYRLMMATAESLAPSLRETETVVRPASAAVATTTWLVRPNSAPSFDQAEALRRAVDQLPEPYRQVLLLRNRDHHPFQEVAGRLGLTLSEARVVWLRAVERLTRLRDQAP